MADLSKQVAAQYRAVAHMAEALKRVHEQIAPAVEADVMTDLLEMMGERSAYIMEVLGDILNGMDAVDEDEDAWMRPVFEEMHKLWPDIRKKWDGT